MRALVIAILLAPVAAWAQPAPSDVLAKVSAYYAPVRDARLLLRYTVNGTTRDGSVLLGRGHRFRVDYVKMQRRDVVVTTNVIDDDTDLWVIDHVAKQITKDPDDDVVRAALAVMTHHDLAATHRVAFCPSNPFSVVGTVLELTPDPPASYRQLLLLVDSTDFHVSEALVIDAIGDWHWFRLFGLQVAAPAKPTWFQVDPGAFSGYTLVTHP